MTNRTAAARILSASDIAAERSARVLNLSTGEIEFVVVVRYIREPSASKQFRTMRVRATDATVAHVAQMAVMQCGPRATVHMTYQAAPVGC